MWHFHVCKNIFKIKKIYYFSSFSKYNYFPEKDVMTQLASAPVLQGNAF